MMEPVIIKGGAHTDQRGTLKFMNDFDMTQVKRFYAITHPDVTVKRGWRGHKIEQRWFYVIRGAFNVELVKVDDWDMPNANSPIILFNLSEENNEVLHIPVGYATCLRAISENSTIVIFADYGVAHAKLDDYLWPSDYFKNKE